MEPHSPYPPKARQRYRIVFLLLLPFLFGQYWFAMKVREPYPAAVLTVFGGVDGREGAFVTVDQAVEVWQAGQVKAIPRDSLLAEMISPLRYFAIQQVFPAKGANPVQPDPELKDWLLAKAARYTHFPDLDSLVVVWNRKTFDLKTNPSTESVETMARIRVLMGGTP